MSGKFLLPSQYKALDGSNYAEWVIPMTSLLESHSFWRHVTGARTKPTAVTAGTPAVTSNQSDIDKWEDADDSARGIITANVNSAIQLTLINTMDGTNRKYATSADCWKYIKDTYGATRGLTSIMLHRKVVRYDFDETPFSKQLEYLDDLRSKLASSAYASDVALRMFHDCLECRRDGSDHDDEDRIELAREADHDDHDTDEL